jgi:hypothetical protein
MPRDESVPVVPARFLQHTDGREVTRRKGCSCGREFTQSLLSESFLAYCDRRGITGLMERNSDGGYVPAFCPACERAEIRQLERLTFFGTPR